MSRKHHDELEGAAGDKSGGVGSTDDATNGKPAVWDTGSSLYDSYELAAVRRLLDKRLLLAAGVLPLRDVDDEPPATGETTGKKSRQVVIVPVTISRAVHQRKATMRALFRALATWAARARPRQAPQLACACAGVVHDHDQSAAAVELDLPPHGQL